MTTSMPSTTPLTPALRCPICQRSLTADAKGARCEQGHSFDRAKKGYLNLLPVQKKNSLNPGDDADMVMARRQFLEAGFYQPLRETLLDIIRPLKPEHLLDSGCGEGWYTTAFQSLSQATTAYDISKEAIRRAAKNRPEIASKITWLVASSHDIPLLDASVDVITAIFTPVISSEAARVLREGGHLLIAAPGEKHLWELREALYEEVRLPQPDKWQEELATHFQFQSEMRVQFPIEIGDNAQLNHLLKMTPHYWRASREKRSALEAKAAFTTQADFRVFVFCRK